MDLLERFIMCRRDEDDEAGFYDRETSTFYPIDEFLKMKTINLITGYGIDPCDYIVQSKDDYITIEMEDEEMNNIMIYAKSIDELIEQYGFIDKDQIYTNGSELITTFRLKQWMDHVYDQIDNAISVTGTDSWYFTGMCNGMIFVKSLLTGCEPVYLDMEDKNGEEL